MKRAKAKPNCSRRLTRTRMSSRRLVTLRSKCPRRSSARRSRLAKSRRRTTISTSFYPDAAGRYGSTPLPSAIHAMADGSDVLLAYLGSRFAACHLRARALDARFAASAQSRRAPRWPRRRVHLRRCLSPSLRHVPSGPYRAVAYRRGSRDGATRPPRRHVVGAPAPKKLDGEVKPLRDC